MNFLNFGKSEILSLKKVINYKFNFYIVLNWVIKKDEPKIFVTCKRLIMEPTNENLGLGSICSMHVGTFDLEHVKVILESFSALFSKLGRNSKTAHGRAKWIKFRPWCVECICPGLTLNTSKSFSGIRFTFSKLGHNWKMAHGRVKTMKIWDLYKCSMHTVLLT